MVFVAYCYLIIGNPELCTYLIYFLYLNSESFFPLEYLHLFVS